MYVCVSKECMEGCMILHAHLSVRGLHQILLHTCVWHESFIAWVCSATNNGDSLQQPRHGKGIELWPDGRDTRGPSECHDATGFLFSFFHS